MGGMGRIYYSSLRSYAHDHNIPLHPFVKYLQALDDTWIHWSAAQVTTDTEDDNDDGG